MTKRTDAERLDYLGKQYGANLVNDDAGRWAVSDSGMQEVPPRGGFKETTGIHSIVHPEQWKKTIRQAIDAYMDADPGVSSAVATPAASPA